MEGHCESYSNKGIGATCYSIDDGFKTQKDSDLIYKSHDADTLPQISPSNLVVEKMTDNATGFIPAVVEKIHDGARTASKVLLM